MSERYGDTEVLEYYFKEVIRWSDSSSLYVSDRHSIGLGFRVYGRLMKGRRARRFCLADFLVYIGKEIKNCCWSY